MRRGVMVQSAALAWLVAAVGFAQAGPPSFEDLARRVKPGSRVRVADQSGAEVTGRLARVTPDEMVVETGGSEKRYHPDTVRQIGVVRRFRLAGALVGAGLWTAQEAWSSCRPGDKAVCDLDLPFIFGAGIGAIAGSFIHKTTLVYPNPGTRVTVAPVISPGAVGLRGHWSW